MCMCVCMCVRVYVKINSDILTEVVIPRANEGAGCQDLVKKVKKQYVLSIKRMTLYE